MDVNDFTFFAALDMEVRERMKEFEVRLLPTLKQATTDTKTPVVGVPLEGYYGEQGEKSKLAQVFRHRSALQKYSSDVVTDSVQKLHDIYSHRVFGLGPARETAINKGQGVMIPDGHIDRKSAIISPMFDTLALAIQGIRDEQSPAAWSIQNIMEKTEADDIDLGTHLVGLAVLVDQIYKMEKDKYTPVASASKYNPVASAMGAETTIGTRYMVVAGGVGDSKPLISEAVEDMAMEVVKAYNDLFKSVKEGKGLKLPTNTKYYTNKVDDINPRTIIGRCVCLGFDQTGSIDPPYYHWGIIQTNERTDYQILVFNLKVVEFKSNYLVTTEAFRDSKDFFSDIFRDKD